MEIWSNEVCNSISARIGPFWIEADSSDFATGAVLSQQSTMNGKWHPVVFYSKSLSSVEWNYKIYDKKMLAIIRVLEEWSTSWKEQPIRWKSGPTTRTSSIS